MSDTKAVLSPSGIPIGTILAFAGEKNRIPEGWLPCDGIQVKNTDYPNLFKSIGNVWGGSGTPNFFLPDLRGMFLRGVSGSTSIDPDKDARQSPQIAGSPNNPGNNGNEVGSIQGSEIKTHDHTIQLGVTTDFDGTQVRGGVYNRG
jgi:microcystin-dependent protein